MFRNILLISIICLTQFEIRAAFSQEDTNIRVTFHSTHPDSHGLPWMGFGWLTTQKMLPPHEDIVAYRDGFKVQETYYIDLQEQQTYFSLASGSKEDYKRVLDILKVEVDELKSGHISKKVDCIVSLCTVEDQNGNEFVIFDSNNDEDFRNDELLSYEDGSFSYGERTLKFKVVNSTVDIEYYDGQAVLKSSYPLSFRKVFSKKIYPECSLRKMEIGEILLQGESYKVGLISPMPGLEYSKYSHLWIDTNNNQKFDQDDFFEQMHQPITLFGKTYEITHVDRFGKAIILSESEAEIVPPVAKGYKAPNFTAVTLDSTKLELSKLLEVSYVLLDFWGTWCGPCVAEVPYLKQAYSKYGKAKLEIVSIGIDDPEKLRSFIHEKELNWVHLQQNQDSRLLTLYQVRRYPTTFLIDQQGSIVASDSELRGENLVKTLDKFLQ